MFTPPTDLGAHEDHSPNDGSFSIPKNVSSSCARLAVQKLIPMALKKAVPDSWHGFWAGVRIKLHGNSFTGMGCDHGKGFFNCQAFPRCWELALQQVAEEYPKAYSLAPTDKAAYIEGVKIRLFNDRLS